MAKLNPDTLGHGTQVGVMKLQIVRTIPIVMDSGAVRTVGQFVDEMLDDCGRRGDEVAELRVKMGKKFR